MHTRRCLRASKLFLKGRPRWPFFLLRNSNGAYAICAMTRKHHILKLRVLASLCNVAYAVALSLLAGALYLSAFPASEVMTSVPLFLAVVVASWLRLTYENKGTTNVHERYGLKVVMRDGSTVNGWTAVTRESIFIALVGLLALVSELFLSHWEVLPVVYAVYSSWSNWHRGGELLHDRLAGTKVVELVPRKLL